MFVHPTEDVPSTESRSILGNFTWHLESQKFARGGRDDEKGSPGTRVTP